MNNNLDEILNTLNAKYIHLIHDYNYQEQIEREYDLPYRAYFCEISWSDDVFMFLKKIGKVVEKIA